MKSKKYGIYVSGILSIISLIILLIFFRSDSMAHDIFLGIWCSALVTLFISISDYFVAKREALEDYYCEAYKIIHMFYTIKYSHISDVQIESAKYLNRVDFFGEENTMNEILKYYEDNNIFSNYPIKPSESEKKNIILSKVEDDRKAFLKAIKSYMCFDSVDLGQLNNAYGKLSFLTEPFIKPENPKSFKHYIYYDLHKKLTDMVYTIKKTNIHFNVFNESEHKNTEMIAEAIKKLNEKLFKIEEVDYGNEIRAKVFAKFYNDIYDALELYRSRIYRCEPAKQMIAPVCAIIIRK